MVESDVGRADELLLAIQTSTNTWKELVVNAPCVGIAEYAVE